MNNNIDIIDQLAIRPVKKQKNKKIIPMNQIFVTNSKLKIKIPKSYGEKLDELQKRTIIKRK